jgi:hypothetical protein
VENVKIAELPRSLKKLYLRYFDPTFDVWKPSLSDGGVISYQMFDFYTHLPELEVLELIGSPAIPSALLALLPSTLVDLSLHCEKEFDAIPMMKHFPRGLRKLSLGQVLNCADEGAWDFPPELDTFDVWLSTQPVYFMHKLPQSLTSFTIMAFGENCVLHPQWKDLPRNLKVFHAYGYDESPSVEYFLQLPQSLESLHWSLLSVHGAIPAMEEDRVRGIWAALPSSLTNIDIDGLSLEPQWLEWMKIKCGKLKITNSSQLGPLPSTLTDICFDSGSLLPTDAQSLPSTLKVLSLETLEDNAAVKLAHLPLTRLSIKKGRLFAQTGVASLPRSLTSLVVGHTLFDSLECFDHLPQLKTFSISTPRERGIAPTRLDPAHPGAFYALCDPQASFLLPMSVLRISLFTSCISIEWFRGLKRLNLLYLTITSLSTFPAELLFECLPESLTSLSGSFEGRTEKAIQALPRGLRRFDDSGWDNGHMPLSAFRFLPPHLYQLSIPQDGFQSVEIPHLPPNLYDLTFRWEQPSWFHPSFDRYAKLRSFIKPCKTTDVSDPGSDDN